MRELERVQQQDPAIPHTWFNLGIQYKKGGTPESTAKAIAQFERMIALDPRRARLALQPRLALQDDWASRRGAASSSRSPHVSIRTWRAALPAVQRVPGSAGRTHGGRRARAREIPGDQEAAGGRRDPGRSRVELLRRDLRSGRPCGGAARSAPVHAGVPRARAGRGCRCGDGRAGGARCETATCGPTCSCGPRGVRDPCWRREAGPRRRARTGSST